MTDSANGCDCQSDAVKALQDALYSTIDQCQSALDHILQNEQKASFVAYQFMMLFGNSVAFWQLSLLACAAQKKIDAGDRDQFMAQKIGTAQFYCSQLLPRNHAHLEAIVCDAKFGDELSFEQT